ncbi:hypothetical protein AMELA_G00099510 [Ameiurus melas]|uniref:Uncharacterized protein n=1 Tax=Ameiurus melas TaxID=219545 RepID=A0A7J6ATA3_AMEME|nr:hypothetical protein AMELA_G00099510 [Ameiurus melas]
MGTAVTGIKLQRMYTSDGGTQWEGDTAGTSYCRTSRRGFNTAVASRAFVLLRCAYRLEQVIRENRACSTELPELDVEQPQVLSKVM